MFRTQTRDVADDFNPRRRRTLWNTPNASMATTTHTVRCNTSKKALFSAHLMVKFEDLYGFMVEGNVDDVNVLNEVRERIREQGRVWWALEASKGTNWYLQPRISSNGGEGVISVKSLKLSVLTNTITLRRLIRKGVPPVLRPKVWLSVSGAAKKRSTVPETYYDELIRATEGKTTPATRQIDHVSLVMLLSTCYLWIDALFLSFNLYGAFCSIVSVNDLRFLFFYCFYISFFLSFYSSFVAFLCFILLHFLPFSIWFFIALPSPSLLSLLFSVLMSLSLAYTNLLGINV
jgi:hypothetical protein